METVYERAVKLLDGFIHNHAHEASWKLPSVIECAELAGISPSTMWKTIKEYVKSGKLKSRRGSGVYTGAIDPHHRSFRKQSASLCKWQKLSAKIQEEIRSGKFKRGDYLPSSGELQRSYGVSYQTLMKSLHQLSSNGSIQEERSKYKVPARAEANSSIVYLGRGMTGINFTPNPEKRAQECYSVLEQECLHSRIRLCPLFFNYSTRGMAPIGAHERLLETWNDKSSILGFVVITNSFSDYDISNLLTRISHFEKPIALYDGDNFLEESVTSRKTVQCFSREPDIDAGRKVGEYLLNLGHTKVLYLTAFHKERWSIDRYEGLKKAYETSGLTDAITFAATTVPCPSPTEIPAVKNAGKKIIEFLESDAFDHDTHVLLENTADLIQIPLEAIAYKKILSMNLQPLFVKMFPKLPSAIVCANDNIAMMLLDFLEQNKVAMPQSVSIIGFDDSYNAHVRGLTSYNFNMNGLAYSMMSMILDSDKWYSRSKEPIRIDGFISERESSGPKKRH